MSKILALLVLLFSLQHAFGQKNLVQGNGLEYRNKTLQVLRYSDLFTFTTEEVATCQIGENGNFSVEFSVEEDELMLLKIGRVNAHLFVQPSVKYTIVLPEPPIEDRYNLGIDPFILPEIFETGGDLNLWISALERDFNAFTMASSLAIIESGNAAKQEHDKIRERYAEIDNEFFQDYFKFRSIQFLAVNGKARSKSLMKTFQEAGINYDQLSFFNAMSILFSDYLSGYSAHEFSDSARYSISNGSYEMLDHTLRKVPELENNQLRELVIITQLFELAKEREYQPMVILGMLEEIHKQTQFREHRTILSNAISRLKYLSVGTKAPNFDFNSVEGDGLDLARYRKRIVYIQFFDQLTPETLRQMSLMKVLKQGYGEDIAMFSLSIGMNASELKNLSTEYNFKWFFGAVSNPEAVRRLYELRSYPTYFLIDENGKFVSSPAPEPGARIERIFAKLYEEKYPGRNKPFKLQPPIVLEKDKPKK